MLTLWQGRNTQLGGERVIKEENNKERLFMQRQMTCLKVGEINREKWRAASQAYRERKKMANAVLDATPLSMEDVPPALVDLERRGARKYI